jgi:hypothetical protein
VTTPSAPTAGDGPPGRLDQARHDRSAFGSTTELVLHDIVIEEILDSFDRALGRDRVAYAGHVYRVFNFTRALADEAVRSHGSIAVAAAFHDLGIWADETVDYLAPSVSRANQFLAARGRDSEREGVDIMIELHHKIAPYHGPREALVEPFRRADLVDLTLGAVRFGLPREFIRDVRAAFPNSGFHACLCRVLGAWALRHPLRPLPMMKL